MSIYCTRSDIEDMYGAKNVAKYADLDNDADTTAIAARIARAIEAVGAEIDDVMRCCAYRLPLETESGTTPTSIKYLAASMAGIWLYEARGGEEYDPRSGQPVHRYEHRKTSNCSTLEEIRAGQRRLDAVL